MTDQTPAPDQPHPRVSRRKPMVIGAIVVGAVIGFAGVYGIAGLLRKETGDPACRAAVDLSRKIAPLAHGEVAALSMASVPLRIPELAFDNAGGAPRKLSDWRGKTVLLNLWATWCVPCRKEMPALDELQGKLGSDKFDVIAINIDTRDLEKPKRFLSDAGLGHLGYFTDQKAKAFQDLKSVGRALGMPTSVLIDPNGCEIATIAGPAEWASPDAVNLIQAALAP